MIFFLSSIFQFSSIERYKKYAPMVLRIGLALVFLWFGVNQLLFPKTFIGYLPSWIVQDSMGIGHILYSIFSILPGGPSTSIYLNGLLEVVLGLLLIAGILTRATALFLTIHLLIICFSLGYNDIAIRDLGLSMATLAVFLYGPDNWCLESRSNLKSTPP